ncbi:Predicted outer membrane protein [uncultured Clostridium sp.]|nr:Predicted outer membrane protein [uncultured Clostridium sp.]
MRSPKRFKRPTALILAVLLLIVFMDHSSFAENTVNLIRRKNIFQGHTIYLFGQKHNEMGFYQILGTDPPNPTFCLQPGKRMPNGSAAPYEKYIVSKGETIPGVGPADKFLPVTCAYNWIFYYTDRTNIPYAVVQTYIWGCMAGYSDDWDTQEQAMQQLVPILGSGVMRYYEDMKQFVISEEERYSSSAVLPSWNGTQQKMILNNGGYFLTLDISAYPVIREASWVFPDSNWSYSLDGDGRSITFNYNGAAEPKGVIRSSELPGTDVQYHAEIFSPPGFQYQVGRFEDEHIPAVIQFEIVSLEPGASESGQLELYRHKETFQSDYNISLEKYCAETNQPLEGTTFNVWEDFDFSQVNEDEYKEGEPEGITGEVYLNCMSPEPHTEYICSTITTDTNGQARHSDTRYYHYNKTYCMGHPAPDWIQCDHEGEGGEGEAEEAEECSCDEENERLRRQWMAEQELCIATCDFHVQNDDEDDHGQDTTAMENMLEDRDITYENFIHLEYSYHLQEKTARTGYILHGRHNDDKEIERVILASAQAGGSARAGDHKSRSVIGTLFDPVYTVLSEINVRKGYTYPLPEGHDLELNERRSILSIKKEKEEKQIKAPVESTAEISQESLPSESERMEADDTESEGSDNHESENDSSDNKGMEEDGIKNPEDNESGSADSEIIRPDHDGTESGKDETESPETSDSEKQNSETNDPETNDSETNDPPDNGSANESQEDEPNNGRQPEAASAYLMSSITASARPHHRTILFSTHATGSNASKQNDNMTQAADKDEEADGYEVYEYTRNPIHPSFEADITFREDQKEQPGEGSGIVRFFASFFTDNEDNSITAFLPDFIDDSLDPLDPSGYGNPGEILYVFKIWNHRTEGRIHINKRDLELYRTDGEGSYGLAQGDGTLEGAVYGLFAAQDLIHPDGKSHIIYNLNDLVAVAATDKNGDASFLVFTEKPGTSLDLDGNLKSPDNATGQESLYNGSSITSSPEGFGTITYPDNAAVNGNQWIGRPLLLGKYYIRELSRSEGYELSVSGISLTESNRTQEGTTTIREAGQAWVAGGLSDYNNMDADGSWNDFIIENYKTENGFDILVSGYPLGTEFYKVDTEKQTENVKVVTGSSLQPKLDENGNPVYQKAKGGEYKTDANGNPMIKEETGGNSEEGVPFGETFCYRFRTAPYPGGGAVPEDMSKWGQTIDENYLSEQVNTMLDQMGYKTAPGTSAWADIRLAGSTNAQAAAEMLDWYTDHSFYDCGQVEYIYQKNGDYYARLLYNYSAVSDPYPAVYDSSTQKLHVRKTADLEGGPADEVEYWIEYLKGEYNLKSKTVSVREKREIGVPVAYGDDLTALIRTVYQPVYETYEKGEVLLDRVGNPIPVMDRIVTYEGREEVCEYEKLIPTRADYQTASGTYVIHEENNTDWSHTGLAVKTTYRAVTTRKTIDYEGMEMPFNQYLTDVAGAGVSVCVSVPAMDEGSYMVTQTLAYPGQNQPFQDGGTGERPVQVLERAIKQSIKITKDISQASYEGVNTYGSLHNDPATVLLGLFNHGNASQGAKVLNQFKFKAYLKSNLENIFVDERGRIISEDIGIQGYKGDVQKIYLPPKDGHGTRLLETKEDGTYHYAKFFDAMYGAGQKKGDTYPAQAVKQFAIDYYDIQGYKEEILAAEPDLNSDKAYEMALKKAEAQAADYLDIFIGLDDRLAIAWDKDPGGGADGDKTTLQCNTKNGKDDYYNHSIMLAYGTYVIAEQTPSDIGKELANRHFNKDYPKEITLPFVPYMGQDENTGETEVNYQTGDPYYRFNSMDTPEDLIRKYSIRFNEESHIIQAHGQDGDFEVFKYGLDKDIRPGHSLTEAQPHEPEYMEGKNASVKAYYPGYTSQSEDAGWLDKVAYHGYETESGQTEIRDHVSVMTGVQTAIDGKFAPMLVPWTVLAPAADRVNPDTGDVETLIPSGSGSDFNFVAFAQEDFEDTYYRTRIRIEKLDGETGENIIHDGALFKLYAAKRDVAKNGTGAVAGTGDVLFGKAVDWEGNPVKDADGNHILYPRVGQSNADNDDLPIRLDREGIPQYDETQLVKQEDREGNETGIFRAYSTVREVTIDGQAQKVPVGYIVTYKPLGAGAYVLVEIQAPEGYTKSRPAAFEIYGDDVIYYSEQRNTDGTTKGWEPEPAVRYQYAVPVPGESDMFRTETVSRINVQDYPSRIEIRKVEDGDSMTGNQNGLQRTDNQGITESSGGFDGDITVNDTGDLLTYKVRGRKEKLEERGDVRDITYDPETMDWYGNVTKALDVYSEHIVEGSEKSLKAMKGVKLLYEWDGTFTGKGIRFDIPVSGARLSLYKAAELERTGEHTYKGVTVLWEKGKVRKITDTNTGTHKEIRVTGQDSGQAALDVWDAVWVENEPVHLYFYDLDTVDTRKDPDTGELLVLDKRGNPLCYADAGTGMAYVYDDYGRILAYTVDSQGDKELIRSIQVLDDGTGQTIYENKTDKDDENALPIYYVDGAVVTKDESWVTDDSTDPHGVPEGQGAVHSITRLPFGAYILQEETVPYSQGYIQARHMGIILRDTEEVQTYFMQNEFTKTAFAKIDVRTQKEIQGASLTLYQAQLDSSGNPVKGEDGIYKKGSVYAAWISGYQYGDDGNIKLDPQGQPIPSVQPHWIDHIPTGSYVLEETICPYEQGYVRSASVNIDIEETGNVQSFEMEDDFTSIEIRKYDTENSDVIYEDSEAWLTLYHAKLDEHGQPSVLDGIPQYDEDGRIFTFRAATYKDGQEVAATGRVVSDAGGSHPIMKYDYEFRHIPGTFQGRCYYTEHGTTRLEYLPPGAYVLTESATPKGYATSDPVLMTVEEKGHLEEIQYGEMGDIPLTLEVSKVHITGGKEVNGASLAIYQADGEGNPAESPLVIHQPAEDGGYEDVTVEWISGLDGRYGVEDQECGTIPDGFKPGDLKPHLIKYIPEGNYILREVTTPYGFLQSVDIPFSIVDTKVLQKVEMTDEIPDGILKITKSDTDDPGQKLEGAQFQLVNKTLNQICEKITTDSMGTAQFAPQPIGTMDPNGNFQSYTYVCEETKAAEGHMMTLKPYEFQFEYKNELTDLIIAEYNPTNDSNRVITEKLLGDTGELLAGVTLRIEQWADENREETGNTESFTWIPVDEWITGKQGHCTKDLSAGKYRLIEIKAADGFKLLAKPIEFTVTDGLEEVPRLIMRNYSTIVEVQKTKAGTDTLLAGARLQLIQTENDRIIREWTSEEESGQIFYGLDPGIYRIHEVQAPSGYKKAQDQEIIVEDRHQSVQVFRFENRVASSSGGGGKPGLVTEYILFKKVNALGAALKGAEFTFYDQRGNVIGTSVSDDTGRVRIKKPKDGTYTFKETKAPAGYALNQDIYSFTVSGPDIIRGIYEIINQEMKVVITKLDGTTGQPLSGARLCMKRAHVTMESVYEGETGEDGTLLFRPDLPGTYTIQEITPPQEYAVDDTVYEFTVEENGDIRGNTTVYNWKKELPQKWIGRITAVYKVDQRFGKGTFHFGTGFKHKIQTGDDLPVLAVSVTAVLCMAGFIFSIRRDGIRKWTIKKKAAVVILFLITIAAVFPSMVMAAPKNDNGGIGHDGKETIYVSGEIIYDGMEGKDPVPQAAWIWAYDAQTGIGKKVLLPLAECHFSNERWVEDLYLDVTVTDYGADGYLIGDVLMGDVLLDDGFLGAGPESDDPPGNEYGNLLAEYEKILLSQAGLPEESYKIDRIRWKGEPYEKNGVMYRDLTVRGRKLVADCNASYSGEVNRSVFLDHNDIRQQENHEGRTGVLWAGGDSEASGSGKIKGYSALLALVVLAASAAAFKMKTGAGRISGVVPALFLAGFIISGGWLAKTMAVYANGRDYYESVRRIAYKNEKGCEAMPKEMQRVTQEKVREEIQGETQEAVPDIDEPALLRINPDYRFWLSIPGTAIGYPVVQHENNQYYLTHQFNREEHIAGSIFADSTTVPLTANHTILYGHNMKDGSMFAGLKQYRDKSFFQQNPFIRIFYNGRWRECPVFSCQIRSENDAGAYRTNLLKEEWTEYLEEMRQSSIYDTGVIPGGEDRIITLSTCVNGNQRLILQAVFQVDESRSPDHLKT